MCPRPSPAHAREEPPTLRSEDVITSVRWRDRAEAGPGGAGSSITGPGVPARVSALERVAMQPLRSRIARAVRAPVVAGLAVFVLAVLVTIGITVASSLGAAMPAGDDGAEDIGGAAPGAIVGGGATGEQGVEGDSTDSSVTLQGGDDAGAGESIFVHVVGAVNRAGVVELAVGDRVRDAIEAAGGANDRAVLAGVNLARLVVDGEQLLVPDEEALAAADTPNAAGAAGAGAAGTAGGAGSAAGAGESLVNLNTADAALLETLPRVGPALAGRIIDWRDANGGFASVEQLLEVTGIGAKTLAGFRDRVTV